MSERSFGELVLLTVVLFASAGFLSLVAVDAVQVLQTPSTSLTITTTYTPTSMTTTSIQHSITTIITTSTLTRGTQSTTASSTITTTITDTTITRITETPTVGTATTTTTSAQSTQVLGNSWGILLVGLASVAAIAVIAAPKLAGALRQGVICRECGNRNPPFAKSYCTRCGNPLSRRRVR